MRDCAEGSSPSADVGAALPYDSFAMAQSADLAQARTLPAFGDVLLRPVRADDGAALGRFYDCVSRDDIHARFFAVRSGPPPGYVDTLLRADCDRDVVLLAVRPDDGEILGGVRLVAQDGAAEIAITIRSDLKHRGLGGLLVTSVLDHARRRGTAEVFADILAANRASLGLARKLGFALRRSAQAPHLVRATLHLSV